MKKQTDFFKNWAPPADNRSKETILNDIDFYITARDLFKEIEERYSKLADMFGQKRSDSKKRAMGENKDVDADLAGAVSAISVKIHKDFVTLERNAIEDGHKAMSDMSHMNAKLKVFESIYEKMLEGSDESEPELS